MRNEMKEYFNEKGLKRNEDGTLRPCHRNTYLLGWKAFFYTKSRDSIDWKLIGSSILITLLFIPTLILSPIIGRIFDYTNAKRVCKDEFSDFKRNQQHENTNRR